MEKINDGGQAFPYPDKQYPQVGMSLRDYFANTAMLALINKQDPRAFFIGTSEEDIKKSGELFVNSIVKASYYYADEMIKAGEQK